MGVILGNINNSGKYSLFECCIAACCCILAAAAAKIVKKLTFC